MTSGKVIDTDRLAAAIGKYLRAHRSAVVREDRIHDGIAVALGESGISFDREYRLTPESRVDLFVPATGTIIEVKKGSVNVSVLPQIGRYFDAPTVTGCVLIAMRIDAKIPAQFQGKPIATIALWKFLL